MVWRNQDPVADGVVVETWSSPLLSRVMFFGQKELFMLIHHLRGTEMLWGVRALDRLCSIKPQITASDVAKVAVMLRLTENITVSVSNLLHFLFLIQSYSFITHTKLEKLPI